MTTIDNNQIKNNNEIFCHFCGGKFSEHEFGCGYIVREHFFARREDEGHKYEKYDDSFDYNEDCDCDRCKNCFDRSGDYINSTSHPYEGNNKLYKELGVI